MLLILTLLSFSSLLNKLRSARIFENFFCFSSTQIWSNSYSVIHEICTIINKFTLSFDVFTVVSSHAWFAIKIRRNDREKSRSYITIFGRHFFRKFSTHDATRRKIKSGTSKKSFGRWKKMSILSKRGFNVDCTFFYRFSLGFSFFFDLTFLCSADCCKVMRDFWETSFDIDNFATDTKK